VVSPALAAANVNHSDALWSEPTDDALAFARRLLDRERAGDESDLALAHALERSCVLITAGMSRWFGVYGSRALVLRALATAQRRHPALAGVHVSANHCLEGVSASTREHGSAPVAEGIVFTIAGLAGLLGRLIGNDIAISLLEQSTMANPANSAPAQHDTSTTMMVKRDE
jgi:hypothetical protein